MRSIAQFSLDAGDLVPFRRSFAAGHRANLELTGIRRDGETANEGRVVHGLHITARLCRPANRDHRMAQGWACPPGESCHALWPTQLPH